MVGLMVGLPFHEQQIQNETIQSFKVVMDFMIRLVESVRVGQFAKKIHSNRLFIQSRFQ